MFSPEPMMRLSAIVLERDARPVLHEFDRLHAIQLTREPIGEESTQLRPWDRGGDIARCDRLRSRLAELRRTLGVAPHASADGPPRTTFEEAEREAGKLEREARELASRRQDIMRRTAELVELNTEVASFRELDAPLDEFGRFEFLHFVTGTLPPEGMATLEPGDAVAILPLPVCDGRQPLLAMTAKRHGASLDDALRRASFQFQKLPPAEHVTASEFLARTRRDEDRIDAELAALDKEWESLATRSSGTLCELEAWAGAERHLLDAEGCFPRTEAAVLITGWVPKAAVAEVTGRLLEVAGGRCAVEVAEPGDIPEKDIPVLLRHHRLLRPFEMLLSPYGLPQYREVAPTLFLAISFLLMFGMMFGDIGHGGLLTVAGLAALLRGRTARIHDCGGLLLLNGLASVAFGFIYGSCFGIPAFKQHALWQDPLEGDPLALMKLGVGVGVVMMSAGVLLNILNHIRHHHWIESVLGKFGIAGIVFYWGALALIAKAAAIRAQGWWSLGLILLLAAPVACWTLKEPLEVILGRHSGQASESGGMLAAVTESVVGAFEGVLLYLANTVSFVRLAAYAMSHAALLMATFSLANEVGRLAVGGPALSLTVIILGNLGAMLLEGVVATVQALRLEYYEFFGKFFSGEGNPFKPFGLAPRPA